MGAIHRLMQTIVMTGDGDSDAVHSAQLRHYPGKKDSPLMMDEKSFERRGEMGRKERPHVNRKDQSCGMGPGHRFAGLVCVNWGHLGFKKKNCP